jgi:hypothetical protein
MQVWETARGASIWHADDLMASRNGPLSRTSRSRSLIASTVAVRDVPQQGNLPEEVAGPQGGDVHSVTHDPGRPPLDEIEAFSEFTLDADGGTGAHRFLSGGRRQALQFGRTQGSEHRYRPQQVEVLDRDYHADIGVLERTAVDDEEDDDEQAGNNEGPSDAQPADEGSPCCRAERLGGHRASFQDSKRPGEAAERDDTLQHDPTRHIDEGPPCAPITASAMRAAA